MGFPGGASAKEPAYQCRRHKCNPLWYSCLENAHGQRNPAGCSPQGRKELDTTEAAEHAQNHTVCSWLNLQLQRHLWCRRLALQVILRFLTVKWVHAPNSLIVQGSTILVPISSFFLNILMWIFFPTCELWFGNNWPSEFWRCCCIVKTPSLWCWSDSGFWSPMVRNCDSCLVSWDREKSPPC